MEHYVVFFFYGLIHMFCKWKNTSVPCRHSANISVFCFEFPCMKSFTCRTVLLSHLFELSAVNAFVLFVMALL